MSSYLKNKVTSSEHYFHRIYNEYPESDYFIESLIMLGNLHLKMDRISSLDLTLERLKNEKKLNNNQKYLYYLLLADYSKYNGNDDDIKKNYLLALENLSNKVDQLSVYQKLIKLSESNQDYSNTVLFIAISRLQSFPLGYLPLNCTFIISEKSSDSASASTSCRATSSSS